MKSIYSCSTKTIDFRIIDPNLVHSSSGLFEIDIHTNDLKYITDSSQDVKVICEIYTPRNDTIQIQGFYYQSFKMSTSEYAEEYTPIENPFWKIRYTPIEEGIYNLKLVIRHRGEICYQAGQTFRFSRAKTNGFVKINKSCNVVQKDNSNIYVNGISIAWTDTDSTIGAYNYYFKKLSEANCNYSRIWLTDWNLPIEWSEVNDPSCKGGVGYFSQLASWKLDSILKMAEKYGIYLMITIGNYGDLKSGEGMWDEYRWSENPYNKENGGFCSTPEEFFTNPDAIDAYKNKLQYIINRWGYSPNIFAFEIWNEYSCPLDWLKSITDFIKTIDPNKHLLTTSISYNDANVSGVANDSAIWMLPNIDFTQTHLYGNGSNIKSFTNIVFKLGNEMRTKYSKPHLFSEIGIDFQKSDQYYDTIGQGTHLNNAAWASIFSGSMGIAITHWKEYIDQQNLYFKFASFSNIISELSIKNFSFENTIDVDNLSSSNYQTYEIDPHVYWGQVRPDTIFLENDKIQDQLVSQYIYSSSKGPAPSFQVFETNYETDGTFSFNVKEISQNARLILSIDDNVIWSKYFSAEDENDFYTYRYYDSINNVYKACYDHEYIFNITKGKHHIKLENLGKDWLRISNIKFGNYSPSYNSLEIFGLQKNTKGILWVHNEKSNWYNNYRGVPAEPIISPSFCIKGFPPDTYTITAYDAFTGELLSKDTLNEGSYGLLIVLDTLYRDIFLAIAEM